MKKLLRATFLLSLLFTQTFAQTNVFPSSGNVGIGTTQPIAKLHVESGTILSKNGFIHAQDVGDSQPGSSIAFTSPNGYPGLVITEGDGNGAGIRRWDVYVGNEAFTIRDYTANGQTRFFINTSGDIGIGTTTPREKLSVNGRIRAKEVKVEASPWPDYVFADDYPLTSLPDLEKYIDENGRLPNIPSADEVANNGISLGEMNAKLLEKIEELTLYIIEQDTEGRELKEAFFKLERELSTLKSLKAEVEGLKELIQAKY